LQRKELYKLLIKYEDLFDGTLCKWNGTPYGIKVKGGAEPYHAQAFPVPKMHELKLKKELDWLCTLQELKKVNWSRWGVPTFIIPKKKNSVCFISVFLESNKWIKHQPYPIPKIQDLLLRLKGFTFGTSLDLNMGYYHIELGTLINKMCTIITPWGKYEYQWWLPMGLCNASDIFREKMSELLSYLDSVRVYLDDILHVTKLSWKEHLEGMDEILSRLLSRGFQINAKKSIFGVKKLDYLGYTISTERITPMTKKVEALLAIKQPTTCKQLCSFISMINYYTEICGKDVPHS
jgi:hypothetical protein